MTTERLFRVTRRHQSWFLPVLVLFVALASVFAWSLNNAEKTTAAVPTTMNFQGRLTDSSGIPMADGLYNMKFRLFTVSSGGSNVWNETRETTSRVQVTNGLFSTRLGEVTPLSASIFNNSTLYFEIELPTPATATCSTASCASFTEGAMTPRSPVATSAYAFNSDTLDGLDSSAFGQLSSSNVWTASNTIQANSNNALQVQNAAGTTTYLNVDTSASKVTTTNLEISSGKSLTIVGGNTASRPTSPTEGMMYFDTDSKQLITYSNGKWQSDTKTATFVVAASNSSQAAKDGAQYVANGEDSSGSGIGTLDGDQIQINNALTAAGAAGGGVVFLSEGTYTIDAAISIPNNVTLAGSGNSTIVRLGNFGNSFVSINMITNQDTSTGAGVVVRDIQVDGRSGINTDGVQHGLYLRSVGGGSRASGAVLNVNVHDIMYTAIWLYSTSGLTVAGNTVQNSFTGIDVYDGFNNKITQNTLKSMASSSLYVEGGSSNNTINANAVEGGTRGVYVDFSDSNIVSNNTILNASQYGVMLGGSNSVVVSGNRISNSGGSTANNGIYLNQADSNSIIGNILSDSSATTTNYAINVSSSTSDTNYLSNNTLGGGSINDIGTGTVYANQLDATGQLISSATSIISNGVAAFKVQNTTGGSALNVDTTNSRVTLRAGGPDAVMGADQIDTGSGVNTFTTGGAWTTTGWTTPGANSAIHTAGNTSALTSTWTPTIGTTYFMQYAIDCGSYIGTNMVNVTMGGVTIPVAGCSTTSTTAFTGYTFTATTAAALTFTPNTSFAGEIYNVLVTPMTSTAPSVLAINNNSNTTTLEVRSSNYASNTFIGLNSGLYTSGTTDNTALGLNTLKNNVWGNANTAIGANSMANNTQGWSNTAVGNKSMNKLVTGYQNVAIGDSSMFNTTVGTDNVAVGYESLTNNISGNYNVAMGSGSLILNTIGDQNVALGAWALSMNTTGLNNTAIGYYAGRTDVTSFFEQQATLQNATTIGAHSVAQASNTVALGSVDLGTKVVVGSTIAENLFSVNPVVYSTGTASQSGTTVNGSGVAWGTGTGTVKVGMVIIFSNGLSARITNVTNTQLTVDTSQTVSAGTKYRIHSTGFQVTSAGNAYVRNTNANAFEVQNSAGTAALSVNTSTNKVTVSDLEVSSGKTLRVVGDTRTNIGSIASPTEGMLTYDTTNKQLLVYANGKWQADRSAATFIVATSNSTNKDKADYVADGTADEVEINAALSALPASGGTVVLLDGTYNVAAPVTMGQTNSVLLGQGNSTVIKRTFNSGSAQGFVQLNATGAEIHNLKVDGNKATYTNANNKGVAINSGTDQFINHVTITSAASDGFYNGGNVGAGARMTNSSILSSGANGANVDNPAGFVFENNIIDGNTGTGIVCQNNHIVVRDNRISTNGGAGVTPCSAGNNKVSGNRIYDNTGNGINAATNDQITDNYLKNNARGISVGVNTSKVNISGNTVIGNVNEGIYVDSSGSTSDIQISANLIADNLTHGITLNNSVSSVSISANRIANNGGSGSSNGIYINLYAGGTGNSIVNNSITDTAGTGYAISIIAGVTGVYLSNNTYSGTGAASINDAGTATIYSNQVNSSGQIINSASSGLATRLISGSSNDLFQAQNSSGTAIMKVTSTGALQAASFDTVSAGALVVGSANATSITLSQDTTLASGKTLLVQGATTVKVTSATAFEVQNAGGTPLLNVNTSASTVTVGSATNGVVLSANGISLVGTARPTRTINLAPEFPGATFTGTGTGNLTSDFCSASARLNINAGVCNTAGDEHNYYSWTSTTTGTQAYEIYIRYRIPSDFSSGSLANVYMYGKRQASASDTVTLSLYQANGSQCGTSTNVATSGGSSAWTETALSGTLGSCTIAAGDMVTFKVSLSVGTNGNVVQAGEIRLDYKSAY